MSILAILLKDRGSSDARKRPPAARRVPTLLGRCAILIPRNTAPLWRERGWRPKGTVLLGHYRTPRGSFPGEIKGALGADPEFYIKDPPTALLNGPHGICFRRRGLHTFYVHWSRRPSDLNAGILRIEQYLLEALS